MPYDRFTVQDGQFIVLSSEDEQALLGSWIGLYSPNNDGEFQWIDGTPLNFTAWSAGEPKTGANGAMLMTQGADRGKWSSTLPKYAGGCFCAKNSY
uniref:C-type lectin domain-containing protein n=1 Tax=Acrobeloides nanus TaxID=290746 RepID=A0A914CUB2_9BILA